MPILRIVIMAAATVVLAGCASDTAMKPPTPASVQAAQSQMASIQNDPSLSPAAKARLLGQVAGPGGPHKQVSPGSKVGQ